MPAPLSTKILWLLPTLLIVAAAVLNAMIQPTRLAGLSVTKAETGRILDPTDPTADALFPIDDAVDKADISSCNCSTCVVRAPTLIGFPDCRFLGSERQSLAMWPHFSQTLQ